MTDPDAPPAAPDPTTGAPPDPAAGAPPDAAADATDDAVEGAVTLAELDAAMGARGWERDGDEPPYVIYRRFSLTTDGEDDGQVREHVHTRWYGPRGPGGSWEREPDDDEHYVRDLDADLDGEGGGGGSGPWREVRDRPYVSTLAGDVARVGGTDVATGELAARVWAGEPVAALAVALGLSRAQVLIACWHEQPDDAWPGRRDAWAAWQETYAYGERDDRADVPDPPPAS